MRTTNAGLDRVRKVILQLEIWRRAIAELETLGITAAVEILGTGVRVHATDGTKEIVHHVPAHILHADPADRVLEHLTEAAESIITPPRPSLVVIDGGKA